MTAPKRSGFDMPSTVQRAAKKDAAIQFFTTARERERINTAAHDARISMSELVRRAVQAYLGDEP